MGINRTRFKSLAKIAEHPAVEEIWDEGKDDGLWIGLNPGWVNGYADTICMHEWTVKALLESFKHDLRRATYEEDVRGFGKEVADQVHGK